ncbi:TolC family protein [Aquabacterium sp.]|uniref:TolC family protein n=1 Tax=Aquabacterium sp. TaxID=1872578 RepID=UPI003784705E
MATNLPEPGAAPTPPARRLRRRSAMALLTLLLLAPPTRATDANDALASLLAQARTQNPELAAMRLDADAMRQRLPAAGAWPEPTLRVEQEDLSWRRGSPDPARLPWRAAETRYTLLQPLPGWGQRALRRDAAQADARAAESRSQGLWLELASRIKGAYLQLVLAVGSEGLAREQAELLLRLEQLARARYAVGLAAQQDVLRAQLEQSALRAELIGLQAEQRQARSRLDTLVGPEATTTALAAAPSPPPLPPLPSPAPLDAAALTRRALAASPVLAAEQARLQGAEASRDLVRSQRYPALQIGIAPTQMGSRVSAWGLMLEVGLPLQREARAAQEREAEALLAAQRARTEAVARQLQGELAEQLAALEAAQRNDALLQHELLPRAELSLQSALVAYEAGKADFATLLDAQRQIRKARQDRLKTQVEARLRLADIERLVGEAP